MPGSSFTAEERQDGCSTQTWGRGRRRPDSFKAACVAETFQPGETLRSVAERRGLHHTQLSHWRAQARRGELAMPSPDGDSGLSFAQVVVGACEAEGQDERLEIVYGDVSLFLPGNSTPAQLVELIHLLGKCP